MKKKVKIAIIAVIGLLLLGMALYPYLRSNQSTESGSVSKQDADKKGNNQNKVLNINVEILKHSNLEDVFRSTGLLIPDEEVELTFETSGKITHIYFKEGSSVQAGTLLAKINDLPLQAELEKLEAQLPLAKDRVLRNKSLLEKEAVSQEEYELVLTELGKLNADIKLVKARIAQTELRAPFDGVIGLRQISEGSYVTPSTIISKLTKLSPLKIEFSVNEKQASHIKVGMPLNFYLDNDPTPRKATVYAIESQLDRHTLSLQVRAYCPNSNGKLKPGRSASVEVVLNRLENALVIPSQALLAEMGRDIAYIYSNGKAKEIVLQKGLRTESSVQILDGLNDGDTLITTGVMQLRDGMNVSIDHVDE